MNVLPSRVVDKNTNSPGLVLILNLMLRASRVLQVKKGVQHTKKHTEIKQNYVLVLFLKFILDY